MSSEKPQGWYRNEKGEVCFEGACFSLAESANGSFTITFDEQCDIDEARRGRTALVTAASEGKVSIRNRSSR